MRHYVLEESYPSPLFLGMIQHSLWLIAFHNDLSIKTDTEHWYFQFPIHAPNTQAAALLPTYEGLSLLTAKASQIVIANKSRSIGSTEDLGGFGSRSGHVTWNLAKILTTISSKQGSSTITEVNILLILFITSHWFSRMVKYILKTHNGYFLNTLFMSFSFS